MVLSSTLQIDSPVVACMTPQKSWEQCASETPIEMVSPTPNQIAAAVPATPPEITRVMELMLDRYRRLVAAASARNAESVGISGLTYCTATRTGGRGPRSSACTHDASTESCRKPKSRVIALGSRSVRMTRLPSIDAVTFDVSQRVGFPSKHSAGVAEATAFCNVASSRPNVSGGVIRSSRLYGPSVPSIKTPQR